MSRWLVFTRPHADIESGRFLADRVAGLFSDLGGERVVSSWDEIAGSPYTTSEWLVRVVPSDRYRAVILPSPFGDGSAIDHLRGAAICRRLAAGRSVLAFSAADDGEFVPVVDCASGPKKTDLYTLRCDLSRRVSLPRFELTQESRGAGAGAVPPGSLVRDLVAEEPVFFSASEVERLFPAPALPLRKIIDSTPRTPAEMGWRLSSDPARTQGDFVDNIKTTTTLDTSWFWDRSTSLFGTPGEPGSVKLSAPASKPEPVKLRDKLKPRVRKIAVVKPGNNE